ncbi:hypothetical protein HMPREF1092_02802, partial [Clostridium thermobutyricum]
ADGTAWETVWESRKLPSENLEESVDLSTGFFIIG